MFFLPEIPRSAGQNRHHQQSQQIRPHKESNGNPPALVWPKRKILGHHIAGIVELISAGLGQPEISYSDLAYLVIVRAESTNLATFLEKWSSFTQHSFLRQPAPLNSAPFQSVSNHPGQFAQTLHCTSQWRPWTNPQDSHHRSHSTHHRPSQPRPKRLPSHLTSTIITETHPSTASQKGITKSGRVTVATRAKGFLLGEQGGKRERDHTRVKRGEKMHRGPEIWSMSTSVQFHNINTRTTLSNCSRREHRLQNSTFRKNEGHLRRPLTKFTFTKTSLAPISAFHP